jgi:signal transduction histidine kinase
LGFAELIEIDGEVCVLAAAFDITDRKRMEETLQELSGHLISAQEEERKRISTELSEVLGQSVALLTIELAQFAQSTGGDFGRKLQTLSSTAQDIASEIGIISQSLYPSTLEYAGLPRAIEGICRQFTYLYDLQVAFKHEGVPPSLPPEVALCLYRIVQEGLQNVVLHSGKRQAWIELLGSVEGTRLALWDNGIGFDVTSVKSGIGLVTMRERCRRVKAEFTIQAQKGVRVEVYIPLRSKHETPRIIT